MIKKLPSTGLILCLTISLSAQNVGINVLNPSEDLHMRTEDNKIAIRLDNKKSSQGINYVSSFGVPSNVENFVFDTDNLNWTNLDHTKLLSNDDIRLQSPVLDNWEDQTNVLRVYLDFPNAIPTDAVIEDITLLIEWKRNSISEGELRLSQIYLQQTSTSDFLYTFGLQFISELQDHVAELPYEAVINPVTPAMLNGGDVFISLYPINTFDAGQHFLEIDRISLQVDYSVQASGTENVYWTAGVKEGNFMIANSLDMNSNEHLAISETGTVLVREVQITKNAGAGKILMSNNQGRAFWTDLPASNVQEIDDLQDAKTFDQNVFLGNLAGLNLTDGAANVGVGAYSMSDITTGSTNTALGVGSLHDNTAGNGNTAVGNNALSFSFNGSDNTAVGLEAMFYNYSGIENVAIGRRALYSNDNADYNIGIGPSALYNNTGDENLAIGREAMYFNVNNSRNTAIGIRSMFFAGNQDPGVPSFNTAVGYESLRGSDDPSQNTGKFNTAVGDQALYFNTAGNYNVAIGPDALHHNKANSRSTAIGYRAMFYADDTEGFGSTYNTAVGYSALEGSDVPSNNTGTYNTAVGDASLNGNTSGFKNTAVGADCMFTNTEGNDNVGMGYRALYNNTTGSQNTSIGFFSMHGNTTGDINTALGIYSLTDNTSGTFNTAIGSSALANNTSATANTAVGSSAMLMNTTGSYNTGIGRGTLFNIGSGDSNTALGYNAGFGSSGYVYNQCTFLGSETAASNNRTNVTMVGFGLSGSLAPNDNVVALGNTAVTEIRAQVSSLTAYSDARIKFDVEENVSGLDFINRLKPVTYNQNPEIMYEIWGTGDSLLQQIDHSQIKQTRFIGFLAQEVEEAAQASGFDFPGLDVPGNEKQLYALRYADFIMPLTKAIQELSTENERLKQENEVLEQRMALIEERLSMLESK